MAKAGEIDSNNDSKKASQDNSAADNESLFSRTHEKPAGIEQDLSKSDANIVSSSRDSLFNLVMKEAKNDFRHGTDSLGNHRNVVEKKDINSTDGLLGSLSITDEKAGKSSDKKPGFEKHKEAKSTESELKDAISTVKSFENSAYASSKAAFITIANKLADDPGLAKMVTDAKGMITKDSIQGVLGRDAGNAIHAEDKHISGPKDLSREQRKSLDTVRTHMETLSLGALAGQIAAQGVEKAGISERALDGMSTREIAKALSKLVKDGKNNQSNEDRILENHDAASKQKSERADSGNQNNQKEKQKSDLTEAGPQKPAESQPQGEGSFGKPVESKKNNDRVETPRENTAQLTDGEFAEVAKRVLAKVDTQGTGKVTLDQLAKAIEDPQFKGKEAQALAAMYQNFSRLHNLSNHEGIFDSKSITAGDLDKFNEIQAGQNQRVNDAYSMKTWAHNNLSKFDVNGSGSLSKDELSKAINDPKTSEYDKRMLQLVEKNYSQMGHFWESGVNLKAFDDYASNIYQDTNEAKLVAGIWSSTYNVQTGQRPETSHDLYADKNNPLNSINPDAIRQGSIGDCYFLASLAAVAKSNPELIKNAIKDNGDGTYTVTFPGAKDEPITIKAPTQAEQGLYNHGSPHGLWASVMEKAYGAYCEKHFWRRGPFNLPGGNTPTEGADGGGRTGGVTKLLTGSDTSTNFLIFNSQATIAANLEKAFSSTPPKAVTAGINNNPFSSTTADQFYDGHAYSIVGFKPDGKGGGMVTIRNPWGGTDGTTSGTITIPLEKFMKNFSDINIQQ